MFRDDMFCDYDMFRDYRIGVREYDEPLGPVSINRERAQAIFFRRRHQPRRPPQANIRPGSPAPAIGQGTGAGDRQR
jgi:hypothetical protein